MKTTISLVAAFALSFCAVLAHAASNDVGSWDTKAAAAYLDQRADWWLGWPQSVRDHDTHCVSCHTAVPYALSRPALRSALGEQSPSVTEQKLLANVTKRVRLWSELEPFYSDKDRGAPKTAESRGTESVLNALILSRYDASQGKASTLTQDRRREGRVELAEFPQSALGSRRLAILGRDARRHRRRFRTGRLPRHSRGASPSEDAFRILPASIARSIADQSRISSVGLGEGARNFEAGAAEGHHR
jgi:hypothetical protein